MNFQLLQNSAKFCGNLSKFCAKGKIPQLGSKFRGPRKTVGATDLIQQKASHGPIFYLPVWQTRYEGITPNYKK